MLYFYSGFTDEGLEEMDCDTTNAYFSAIEAIEAQEMLKLFQVESFQNSKKEQKTKLFRKYKKLATPRGLDNRKVTTTEELAGIMDG